MLGQDTRKVGEKDETGEGVRGPASGVCRHGTLET